MAKDEKDIKLSSKEELEDSLEFCEDIYKYYKSEDKEVNHFDLKKPDIPEIEVERLGLKLPPVKEKEVIVEKQSFFSQILFFAVSIVVAIFLSRLINGTLIQETRVDGHSMNPTLFHNERLILNKFSYKNEPAKRFDIVVFSFNNGEHFVKRIIGLPGEKVNIKDGKVYINDELLSDDPIKEEIIYPGIAEHGVIVGSNQYFVLGDNRNHSYDSRYKEIGTISNKVILGKVWIRFFPFSEIGFIE